MKNWPLRWKVALYSASLAVTATLAGATTTWFVMRHAEIAAFYLRLTTDAEGSFRDVEHFEGGRTNSEPVFKEIFVPPSLRKHLVEATDASGAVLYLSPRLRQPFPRDGIKEFHNHKIDGKTVRVAEFSENGRTLRAGDDLKEINQIGRDIFLAMLGAIPTVLLVTLVGSAWIASKAIAPVEEIRQAAKRITAQRLDQRLPVPPTKDEIAGLIEMLNATFERLQRSFEQSARFSADASHHLKTPIAILAPTLKKSWPTLTVAKTHKRAPKDCYIGFITLVQSWRTCFCSPAPMPDGSSCRRPSSSWEKCSRAFLMTRSLWPSRSI